MTKPMTDATLDNYIFPWANGFFVHCPIEAVKIENLFDKSVIMVREDMTVRLKFSDLASAREFVTLTLRDGVGVYLARQPAK